MAVKTFAKRAQSYRDLIDRILVNPNQSYTALGKSFTKHDLQKLEDLAAMYDRKASARTHGRRAAADLSTRENQN